MNEDNEKQNEKQNEKTVIIGKDNRMLICGNKDCSKKYEKVLTTKKIEKGWNCRWCKSLNIGIENKMDNCMTKTIVKILQKQEIVKATN